MADYKEMYLTMMRAAEQAIHILIAAQQACEEAYLQEDAPHVFILESEGLVSVPSRGAIFLNLVSA